MGRKTFVLGAVIAVVAAAALAFILFPGGERNTVAPVGVAEAFLDAYYVSIDLEKARQLTGGLAGTEIGRQIKSIRKITRFNKNPSKVRYRLLGERSLGERKKAFSFNLTIEPRGGHPFQRVVFLHLRRENRNWLVHAFREHNP